MTLGESLLLALSRSGKTREEIKKETKLSLPTIRKILKGNKDVTLTAVEKVANSLNVKIKYSVEQLK